MRQLFTLTFLLIAVANLHAQKDSADAEALRRMVNLSEVVIRSDLNVPRFLQQVKYDTSFYKAFKNLRVLSFTSLNDIRMMDKRGKVNASLQSRTRQKRAGNCRTMDVLQETTTGDIRDGSGDWNYYTAELYAGLFFTNGQVCNESNVVAGTQRKVRETKGLEKHKEQLKMMFFNPGKKIPGIPFIGNKLDVFDPEVARLYDFNIDVEDYREVPCYKFSIVRKADLSSGERDKIVYDNITTWFDARNLSILGRNYDLSYNAGVYDFDVNMEVQMTQFNGMLVPQLIRYNGNWDVAFKKREKGIFTATLFDFAK
ncbi:hypothetical protein SAMN05444008_102275 [Cnuella takakiae]|uniref:Uncharacterized protein n=1 Tax=Cnuella takakiae TaxID=1302690 RepID=A0A1M4VIJ4_9BACT|nr:hypothetical protein [Cnuella takakiae]OLY92588.1 hypothetical protein BUE76_12335 [Cnuella takakiae]SHE68675.1 hypothetical protein SAMN05444008_102275 [Cnuella takakiae]